MTWAKSTGVAIVTHPYIASGKHQISLLTGDHLLIYEKLEGWFHGRNLLTEIDGIFPECCVSFSPLDSIDKIDTRMFLTRKEDLLLTEARLTINYALNYIKKSDNAKKVCTITRYIVGVVEKINSINSIGHDLVFLVHQELANAIDELRKALGFQKTQRTKEDAFSTLTTWEEEQFTTSISTGVKKFIEPEYVVFHCYVDIINPKKVQFYRFFLYQSIRTPWISIPVTKRLCPENSHCDLLFNMLEKRDMKHQIYLVVYIYDIPESASTENVISNNPNSQENNKNASRSNSKNNINSNNTKDIWRDCVGVGYINFPSVKTDLAFKKGSTQLEIHPKTSTSNIYKYGPHEAFISNDRNCNETIKPIFPEMKVTFTPYFGVVDQYIEDKSITNPTKINSMFLPSVISAKNVISMLSVTISGITQHSSRKKSRTIARLYDSTEKKFLQRVESPITGQCDSEFYSSVSFKGVSGKRIHLIESFSIDLNKVRPDHLKNLYVALEIQRYLHRDSAPISSSYTMIPLTNSIGDIQQVNGASEPLHHFPFKKRGSNAKATEFEIHPTGKEVGNIEYDIIFSSTVLTPFEPLYKLLYYQRFENELESIIKNFTQPGMAEWSKFFKKLATNLAMIISSKPEYSKIAFDQLVFIFSEILTRGRPDYVQQINEVINEQFNPAKSTSNHAHLTHLYERMIPLLLEMIYSDDTTQNFRNSVKCSSYFINMSMRTVLIKQLTEEVDFNAVIEQLERFFKRLSEIVADVPSDANVQRKGFVFTNQQLILQHFASMIISLLQCIDPVFVSNIVVKFISSIRFVPEDRKQVPLDKSKMRVLLSLARSRCWTDPKARAILENTYTSELTKASSMPHCVTFIVPILSSLFLAVRNNFIVQFIELLYDCFKRDGVMMQTSTSAAARKVAENNVTNMSRLLLIIAYTFPDNFSLDYLLELVHSDLLSPQVRMFVYSNVVLIEKKKLKNIMKSSQEPKEDKIRIIETYLSLSILSSTKGPNALDNGMNTIIYPITNDYKTCKKLFESLPKEEKVAPVLLSPLLHCCLLHDTKDLRWMFYKLVKTDIKLNGNPKNILNPTLEAVHNLAKYPGFEQLLNTFKYNEDASPEVKTFLDHYSKIILSLKDIQTLFADKNALSRNSDKLSEAINIVINASKEADNPKILSQCILKQAELHLTCENFLEAAQAYVMLLNYIPVDHNLLEKQFQIDGAKSGIQLHSKVLLKVINLYMRAKYDEYGLDIVKKLRNDVVKPFKYYDIMKTIMDNEAKLYNNITTQDRKYSNFYFVRFSGEGFDENYYKNRSFVYRRPANVELQTFMDELSGKFPIGKVGSDLPPNDKDPYIQVYPLTVALEEEANDPFYIKPSSNQMKYQYRFEIHKNPHIFRYEKFIKDNTKINSMEQFFYYTKESFPCLNYRVEIDVDKSIKRQLEPIETAIVTIKRKTADIKIDNYYLRKKNERGTLSDVIESGLGAIFTTTLNVTVKDLLKGATKKCIDSFILNSDFSNDQQNTQKVTILKESIKEQIEILDKAIEIDDIIVSEQMKSLHFMIAASFNAVKEKLHNIIIS
ncbi:hypothetical protein TRFO_11015 [Tritrichomonas foetus]|uniref:SH3 domain-containing protein n=1 Tax=Tritrichomonas foetus TaxID=1144522 RepID=A0A1J4JB18_9EUKA|nr:hypothetical protein TRFO_11015 [Tritrichomonas foetus]|eukprot:OHS94629.1 hypothetical protein TRFO_11015 [Tritrichomonas foetus]